MSFNTIKSTTKTIGGSHHVWHEVNRRLLGGGVLPRPLPVVGTLIPAGTPVNIPGAGGECKFLEVYELTNDLSATDTEVRLNAGVGLPVPKAGQFLMVVPDKADGTGKAVKLADALYDEKYNVNVLTITAGDLGALKAGALLVNATKEGTGAKMFTTPNALTWNDVYISEGVVAATVAGIVSGIIYADRITPVPDCIKALLPQITFQKGV